MLVDSKSVHAVAAFIGPGQVQAAMLRSLTTCKGGRLSRLTGLWMFARILPQYFKMRGRVYASPVMQLASIAAPLLCSIYQAEFVKISFSLFKVRNKNKCKMPKVIFISRKIL